MQLRCCSMFRTFSGGICSQNGFFMLLVLGGGSLGFVQVDSWSLSSTLYSFICCTYVVSVRCNIESTETSQLLSWLCHYRSHVLLGEKHLMSVYMDSDNGAPSAPQHLSDPSTSIPYGSSAEGRSAWRS